MNSPSQINLQIKSDPENAADFFISLYKFKKKHGKIPPMLFPLEGIELNKIPITLLKPTKEDLKNAETKIRELYDFISALENSNNTYKEFKEDEFTKVLQEEIILFEICRKAFNSDEISLFNICISLTTEVLDKIGMDAIGETFARQMLIIYLNTISQNADNFFETELPKIDNFQVTSTYFDQHYYYEKEGMFIPFTEKTTPDYFSDYYLQRGKDVVRCKTNSDDEVMEVTIYQKAAIQNQKLITSSEAETLYIPMEESGSFFASLYEEAIESEDEDSEEELSDFSEHKNEENPIPVAAYLDAFHRYGSFMAKAPENKKEYTEFADRCIFHFYRLLKSNYSQLTEKNLMIVTGYVCSLLGVLDDDKISFDSGGYKTDFREYLYLSVQEAMKRHIY